MNSAILSGQEMDEGLEEMWTESIQKISRINPRKFWLQHHVDAGIRTQMPLEPISFTSFR